MFAAAAPALMAGSSSHFLKNQGKSVEDVRGLLEEIGYKPVFLRIIPKKINLLITCGVNDRVKITVFLNALALGGTEKAAGYWLPV